MLININYLPQFQPLFGHLSDLIPLHKVLFIKMNDKYDIVITFFIDS